jgi:hypothetical protein
MSLLLRFGCCIRGFCRLWFLQIVVLYFWFTYFLPGTRVLAFVLVLVPPNKKATRLGGSMFRFLWLFGFCGTALLPVTFWVGFWDRWLSANGFRGFCFWVCLARS